MSRRRHARLAAFGAGIIGLSLFSWLAAQDVPARGPATFESHDQNGDGAISEAEFNAVRAQRVAGGRPMAAARSFASLDANHDGRLSPEEFAATRRPAGSGPRPATKPSPPGGRRGDLPAFADFDRNSDGRITEQEFNEARVDRATKRAEDGRLLRGMADRDSFAEIDTNHDGAVSPAEFAAHQVARRQDKAGG